MESIKNIKQEISKTVERNREEIYDLLQHFVRIPSVTGEEGRAQKWVKSLYASLGLEVKNLIPVKVELIKHPAYVETGLPYNEERPNIIGVWLGHGKGRSLILNGHVDVVSPEPLDSWEDNNPWSGKIQGDRLFGRGAADMKSGLLANYLALKTLLDLGLKPSGKVILESVIEEEAGGSGGTLATFLAGYKADGLVISEPFNMKIVIAHPGINYFRIKIYGKTAHAAQSHKGVNAIGLAAKLYHRLVKLDEERARRKRDPLFEKLEGRSCNLNIGTCKAGDWPSTVAGWAQLESRISYLPGEREDEIQREVEDAIREVAGQDPWLAAHPPKVEWFGWRAKPWIQDQKAPLVQQFQKTAAKVLPSPPEIVAATAGLDTRFGSYFNTPSIVFGPKGGLLHSSNEYVELDSVINLIKILSLFIVDWCGID